MSKHRPAFERYIGIDYSGAKHADASLPGIRVFEARHTQPPTEITPPKGTRKYWTRRGLANWLIRELTDSTPTLVGIDHGLSFPLQYFETNKVPLDWDAFLEDFHHHWPTDQLNSTVDSIRDRLRIENPARLGSPKWRRLSEVPLRAKSVFHFDVPGSVAKSTHAGLPWIYSLRKTLPKLHFWPFDGWLIPSRHSALAEAYPATLKAFQPNSQNLLSQDQADAYAIANWLQFADQHNQLNQALAPPENPHFAKTAKVEGWILTPP